MTFAHTIATELGVEPRQVSAAITLLDEGATVPFIARYRKEKTGALDDEQLRALETRLIYLRQLEERRQSILHSLQSQNLLTPDLTSALANAETKVALEDIYQPYKPKRRTKAQIAREAGLEPLARALLNHQQQPLQQLASGYLNPDQAIHTPQDALIGAQNILIEMFSEHPRVLQQLRQWLWQEGSLSACAAKGKAHEHSKFRDYYNFQGRLSRTPSHRALALFRGESEGELKISITPPEAETHYPQSLISQNFNLPSGQNEQARWLQETTHQCWKKKLAPQLSSDLFKQLKEQAEAEAIQVFARNLKALLLAPPAGDHVTLGLDPGLRTGVKAAIVDHTGKLLDYATLYPHPPQKQWDQALAALKKLVRTHKISLISIGNGTASRETESLARTLAKQHTDWPLTVQVVSEAGASVYSASALASAEFPELDVTLRGAVSIARRLQDPLAELVKIDPKAIGVGQYQHDVDQKALTGALHSVVEDCVNHVGVDLNTASIPLLTQVAGLNQRLAENIVAFRDTEGAFVNRQQLLKVPRLGPKAFEQCAAFLRIPNAAQPLDNSAVHPEAYPLVDQMAKKLDTSVATLVGTAEQVRQLNPQDFICASFGEYTVRDVLGELEKPGRDPRPSFRTAQFDEQINTLSDLSPGMLLEGIITNVTNFGAFVDIGVHQDGLVHISQLSNQFVKDPQAVVKAGDIVSVRVTEVDAQRKRIGLSMKSEGSSSAQQKPCKAAKQKPARSGNLSDSFKASGFKIK